MPATGQHAPLDAWVTYLELEAAAEPDPGTSDLSGPIAEARELCQEGYWATDNPLGIGGLLTDARGLRRFGRDSSSASKSRVYAVLCTARTSSALSPAFTASNWNGLPPAGNVSANT